MSRIATSARWMAVSAAALAAAALTAGCAGGGYGYDGGGYGSSGGPMSNREAARQAHEQRLEDRVMAALRADPRVGAQGLRVTSEGDGTVMISGTPANGIEGRTLALMNRSRDRQRREQLPIPQAHLTNLRAALQGVGQRMDPAEDLLLLYLHWVFL